MVLSLIYKEAAFHAVTFTQTYKKVQDYSFLDANSKTQCFRESK